MSINAPLTAVFVAALAASAMLTAQSPARPRARDLGIAPGPLAAGPLNAITDVAGVRVGHKTLVSGEYVRTGVTAILPHDGNLFQDKVAGAVFVGNAFGKLAGSTQVAELGTIETPIVLTNTLAVGTAMDAVVRYTLAQPGNESVRSVNALVGETNDGGLNDIRGMHVAGEDVLDAIRDASGGAVEEGSVGAGTGTICFGWKGGIGTSSRRVQVGRRTFTVGALVQTNFGGRLRIAGIPTGIALAAPGRGQAAAGNAVDVHADGSCMIVVATDAPVDARELRRIAARAVFALARTGSTYSNGSGDFAIAFSTSPELRSRSGEEPRPAALLSSDDVSPLFEATLDSTEEAVYNSLFRATTVTSSIGSAEAIPVERVRDLLRPR